MAHQPLIAARLVAAALLALVTCVVAFPAAAEEGSSRELMLQPPAVERSSLDTRWEILRQSDPGSLDEERAFVALERTALELGFAELPAHSLVLLLDAEAARAAGDVARAALLRRRAEALAPTSPQPAFFAAHLAADRGPGQIVPLVDHLRTAYGRLGSTVAGYVALQTLWRQLLVLALGLLALAVGAGVAAGAVGPASMDLRLLSRRALTLGHGRALALLGVLAPALVLWSPFAFLVAAFVVAAPYLRPVMRVVALAALAGVFAIPTLVLDQARIATAPAGELERPLHAIDGVCDAPCIEDLTERTDAGDELARLALAWTSYRRGTPTAHREALAWLDGGSFDGALAASAAALRGNIAFNEADYEAAESLLRDGYDDAASNGSAALLISLYRVQVAMEAPDVARQTVDQAVQTSPELVERYVRRDARSQNLILPICPVPASALTERLSAGTDEALAARARDEMLAPWYGRVPAELAPVALAGAALWLVLGAVLHRRRLTSCRCQRCGTPTSRFVLEDAWAKGRCVLCFQLDSAAGQLSYAQRTARQARIITWDRWTGLAAWTTALFAPGLSHVAAGRGLVGGVLVVLWSSGVALLVLDRTPLSIPYALGAGTLFDGLVHVGAIVLGVAVLLSLVSTWVARRDA